MSDLEYAILAILCALVMVAIIYDTVSKPDFSFNISNIQLPNFNINITPTNTTSIDTTQNTTNPFHMEGIVTRGDLL